MPTRWQPRQGTTWQWQLSGTLDLSVDAEVYDLDHETTSRATVTALRAAGRHAICYFSAGSFEPYRADAAQFPAAVRGAALDGWPDERWLDIRRLDVLLPLMSRRIEQCRAKGFQAVEPDNVDGYANDSGFDLTAADQLAYNRAIARLAHQAGLSVALKNDVEQIPELVADFDFAINEQCAEYDECAAYRPFIAAGKAVLHVEYTDTPDCTSPGTSGFSTIGKREDLDAPRFTC